MKKLLIILSACITMLAAMGISAAASETMYVANVDDSVYLRYSPASDGYYTTIPLGTAVTSVGWSRGWDGEGYNQVKYNGYTGWVTTKYLSKYRTSSSSSVVGETMYVANVSDAVYLRHSPASDGYYTIIPLGTAVKSIGWAKGWDGRGYNQVMYNGYTGWITTDYLSRYKSYGGSSYSGETMYVSNVSDGVYLRTSPASDNYYVIIPVGARVTSIGWQMGWDGVGYNKVKYNGYTGWITTRYLSY